MRFWPNNRMLRTETSRLAQFQPEPKWRLASAADAKRWAETNIMRIALLPLLAVTFLFCSCAKKTVLPAEYRVAEEGLRRGYCSQDPAVAEKALQTYRGTYEKWRSEGIVGIEYESVFGWTDARLMKIYSHMGDSNTANRYFQSAVTNLAVVSARHGGQPELMTREVLEQKLKKADEFLYPELQWKRRN